MNKAAEKSHPSRPQKKLVRSRILICSHAFDPSVGGIETVTALVATALTEKGYKVRLVTQTPGAARTVHPFEIFRQPSASTLLKLWKWSELVLQSNISLQTLWPRLLFTRRVGVVTHTWIQNGEGRITWRDRLKLAALRHVSSAAVSHALAERLGSQTQIVPDPYDDGVFREMSEVVRSRDLVFVGRLVSDKGADLLVTAVARLRDRGHVVKASIIGAGPEEAALRARCEELGILPQVEFCGPRHGADLARQLNAHRIMVVPSRWAEPFGIVALEGIACGCVVVGSNLGGLPEAIGDCGRTFPNGNAEALAGHLLELLTRPETCSAMRKHAGEHLRRHTRAAVAERYLCWMGLSKPNSGRNQTDMT